MSNGGSFAPLVPDRNSPCGYIVIGGWLKTWYEHMLDYERRRLTLMGTSPGEINAALTRYESFYELYLIVAEAWSRVRVPVLAIHGEYDWIMGAEDHREMVRMSASHGATMSRVVEVPRTSHLLERLESAKAALDGSGEYNADVGAEIVSWLKALSRSSPGAHLQPCARLRTTSRLVSAADVGRNGEIQKACTPTGT